MLTNRQEIIFFSSLAFVLFVFLVFTYIFGHRRPDDTFSSARVGVPMPLENISINARAAYVYDLETDTILYAKNADERLPLASLTKVMSALVASELAPEYSTVVVSREAIHIDGDAGLLPGERWSLKDLLNFSLISSANDGVRAIALALGSLANSTTSSEAIVNDFVHMMNNKADILGMKNTYFFNDTGLDESREKSGAYGTARDMTALFAYILKNNPNLLSATKESTLNILSLDGIAHTARNTDMIVNKIPGLVASKTGFTDLAGGNLVIAFDPEVGHPIIISILGSSSEGRFDDCLTLMRASLASVQNSVESHQ
ncbi:serine hydrolase [Candidatus Parcubacteria bacterium]|nr:serine hydrolase [Candidatus Parcubacteria bacterium]